MLLPFKRRSFGDDLARAGKGWRTIMAPHADDIGIVRAFPEPVALQAVHVAGAQLFANRYDYIASLPKGAVAAEVGVWMGDFSSYILDTNRPRRLYLIDRDLGRASGRFTGDSRATLYEGDSVAMLERLPDKECDWIYIDAGHTLEAVQRDAQAAATKIKDDGLLIFNDYIFWSHTEALPYGVVHVVNSMCVDHGWRVAAFCLHNGMYCDIAIRRR